jgi:thiol-disulfide isomerase/thioredoxin
MLILLLAIHTNEAIMFRILVLVLLFLSLSFVRAEEASSYDEAVKIAKKDKKKIFLYFGASWCAPCQAMKKMFKEKEVKEKLDKFVVLIVDVDENPTLKKKYKVKSIPDYRILNSDLEVEKKFVGGQTKYKFAKWLDD